MSVLNGGFAAPAHESARNFRALMEAMARPGTRQPVSGALPPAPLSPAAGAAVLTLLDETTPLHLAGAHNCPEVAQWITFHTGAPLVTAEEAQFALGEWEALLPLSRFAEGDPAYPDRSATLILELTSLMGDGPTLTGPGIQKTASLPLPEVDVFRANAARFPLGFDCFLTAGSEVAALPRSTKLESR